LDGSYGNYYNSKTRPLHQLISLNLTGGVKGKEMNGQRRRAREVRNPANNTYGYTEQNATNAPGEMSPNGACGVSDVKTGQWLGAA